ncbi:MAG: AraC family transcriptional regulator [Methylococcales bacterium]|nr:AraC family transcriptional regulator [Methylococcales bacterium]
MTLVNLDDTQKGAFLLPNLPVISSCKAGWDKLHLDLHQQPAFCMPEHVSPNHVICVNVGNPVTLDRRVDGQSQTIDAVPVGDIGIYPANLRQTFHWHQDAAFLQLYLKPTLLTQAGTELFPNHDIELLPQLVPGFDPLIYHIAVALKTALEVDGGSSKLYADAMANALAVHLLSRYSTHKPSPSPSSGNLSEKQLKRVLDHIHAYLDRNVRLAELADEAQLSSYHFARLFKQSMGIAPHQYHIRCRIERVKQLLLEKRLSLAEISYAVGFANQGHLNYHFKHVVGMTPQAFLRQK